MGPSLSPEQNDLVEAVAQFARKELNRDVEDRIRSSTFSKDTWRACADFGILSLPMPERYGGSDQGVLTTIRAMEALGKECRDQGLLFSMHAHMWSVVMPILSFGTEDQKEEYLRPLTDGTYIGAHGMSEPDSGSDAFSLRAYAKTVDGGYVLNGTKTFVTNAPVADLFVLFATVAPKRGMWGVTAFLVEKGTPGLSVSEPFKKMGLKTSPMSEVVLEDCHVPTSARIGAEGQGAVVFNHSMAWERGCILASQVGAMEHQLEFCLAYAKERKQFGRPIGDFQLVAARLADMKVRLDTSRLLLYKAASAMVDDVDTELASAVAKLYISEAALASALDAVRTFGGYGFMEEFEVERDLRDFLGGTMYSGTSDIQRLIIARQMGLRPS
ncbi:MAG: acyl-CoA dehydrogenase family protein [Longimicrobiales bacterium]